MIALNKVFSVNAVTGLMNGSVMYLCIAVNAWNLIRLNRLVNAAVFVFAGSITGLIPVLIPVADLVGETIFAVLASVKFWLLDDVVSTTDGVDGLVCGAVLVASNGLTQAELLSKEVYDLVMRGIELIDYHHFLPLGSALTNVSPLAVIIIVVICFKISSKYTRSTKGQEHPEIILCARRILEQKEHFASTENAQYGTNNSPPILVPQMRIPESVYLCNLRPAVIIIFAMDAF